MGGDLDKGGREKNKEKEWYKDGKKERLKGNDKETYTRYR